MDIIQNTKPHLTIVALLLLSFGMLLSGNTFAANATRAQLVAERNARIAADNGLTTGLTAERNTRIAADSGLNTELTAERNARIATDNALSAVITTPAHAIGDVYGGGIVFYVDAEGQHGLIAARADQSAVIQWYNGIHKVTGTTGDGIGAGAMNTALIVAAQISDNPTGNFAAKVATDYSVQEDGVSACTVSGAPATEICYGDWYLPSKAELNLLFQQKSVVGGFADDYYWSSTEVGSNNSAWFQVFADGSQHSINKDEPFRVRAVRAF
jgi:Protein of unknown function (DUF1566)